jgi:hypothetical protein
LTFTLADATVTPGSFAILIRNLRRLAHFFADGSRIRSLDFGAGVATGFGVGVGVATGAGVAIGAGGGAGV